MANEVGPGIKSDDPRLQYVHMLKEARPLHGQPTVVTGCGMDGSPPTLRVRVGIKTTGWASWVTCPVCRLLPGVRGPMRVVTVSPEDDQPEDDDDE